jgi:hypothetical protein
VPLVTEHQHALPAIRVSRAKNAAAEELAGHPLVWRQAAMAALDTALDVVQEGARRVGWQCSDCGALHRWGAGANLGGGHRCSACGSWHEGAVTLLVAWDPV